MPRPPQAPTTAGYRWRWVAARPSLAALYGSLALNSLTVRKAVPALEKLAKFYNIGVFEKS